MFNEHSNIGDHSFDEYITNISLFKNFLDNFIFDIRNNKYKIDKVKKIYDIIDKCYDSIINIKSTESSDELDNYSDDKIDSETTSISSELNDLEKSNNSPSLCSNDFDNFLNIFKYNIPDNTIMSPNFSNNGYKFIRNYDNKDELAQNFLDNNLNLNKFHYLKKYNSTKIENFYDNCYTIFTN